jgi:hypothetical protein
MITEAELNFFENKVNIMDKQYNNKMGIKID